MKYFTKEWYEACQAADWCLNMAVQYKRILLKVSGSFQECGGIFRGIL